MRHLCILIALATMLGAAPRPAVAAAVWPDGLLERTQRALTPVQFGFGRKRCAAPSAIDDADVARNLPAIAAAGLCLREERLAEGGWRFTVIENRRRRRGPVWYLPHDNEREAFDAALYAVARYGGRMVAVEAGERRNFRGLDPNRLFASSAAQAAPCAIARPYPAYTRYVMGLFRGARHIFAIHNNARGGGVSVNVDNAKLQGFRAGGPLGDPDHLVYIAGERPLAQDRAARTQRDRLLRAGLNVVHEHVTRQNNDCSLSNHVVLNDGRTYFNVEAVHGSRLQKAMVDALLRTLGYSAAS